jgi:hypothetical protein
VKLRSAPLDDVFAELDFVLRQQHSAAAGLLRREAHRRYRALHREFLRLLRAAERGDLAQRRGAR